MPNKQTGKVHNTKIEYLQCPHDCTGIYTTEIYLNFYINKQWTQKLFTNLYNLFEM
jgi:hypothetical protein